MGSSLPQSQAHGNKYCSLRFSQGLYPERGSQLFGGPWTVDTPTPRNLIHLTWQHRSWDLVQTPLGQAFEISPVCLLFDPLLWIWVRK